MNNINNLRFILHVSDVHLNDREEKMEHIMAVLKELAKRLKSEGCKVEYLIHTGDVINSSDLFDVVAKTHGIPSIFWEEAEWNTPDGYPVLIFLAEDYAKAAISNSGEHQVGVSTGVSIEELDRGTVYPTMNHL